MTRFVEIEGGVARIIDREVVREVALAEVMPHIETRIPVMTPILPRNHVRIMRYDESNHPHQVLELLISLDPAIRTLPYREARTRGEEVRVSMPYVLFYLRLITDSPNPTGRQWSMEAYKAYYSRAPITDMNQRVIPALLPNVYTDARICLGNTGADANQPLADRIDQFVNDFLLSEFTDHGVREFPWPFEGRTGLDYGPWVTRTQQNPACWRDIPEFDENNGRNIHPTIAELFRDTTKQGDPIVVAGMIPVVPTLPTYGRAEEWALNLNNWERLRLKTVLAALEGERPDLFTQTEQVPRA